MVLNSSEKRRSGMLNLRRLLNKKEKGRKLDHRELLLKYKKINQVALETLRGLKVSKLINVLPLRNRI